MEELHTVTNEKNDNWGFKIAFVASSQDLRAKALLMRVLAPLKRGGFPQTTIKSQDMYKKTPRVEANSI